MVDESAKRADASENDFAAFADDGGRIRLTAIKMAADAFGRERNRRERILNFVSNALGHFFPCQLALGAEQFRSVFNHQDSSGSSVCQFEARAGDGEMHVTAAKMEFQFGGCRAHSLSAAYYAGKFVDALGWQQSVQLLTP